jgi:hypothetical protein
MLPTWHEVCEESEMVMELARGVVLVDREQLPDDAMRARHTRLLLYMETLLARLRVLVEACGQFATRIQRRYRLHLRQMRRQALAMALHPRLGERSLLSLLPGDVLRQGILVG